MNKSSLIEMVADKAKMTKKRAEDLVNLFFDSMVEALQRGDRVSLEVDYLAKLVWQFTGSGSSAAAARRPGRAGRIPARRR